MSASKDAPLSPRSQLALGCFEELPDYAVADVASECRRTARLGVDRSVDAEEEELRVSAEPAAVAAAAGADHCHQPAGGGAAEEGGSKGGVDVFGQTHPAVAADVVECGKDGSIKGRTNFAEHVVEASSANIVGNKSEGSIALSAERGQVEVDICDAIDEEDVVNSQPVVPYIGMKFDSVEEARSVYNAYAFKLGFTIRVGCSRKSSVTKELIRNGSAHRRELLVPKMNKVFQVKLQRPFLVQQATGLGKTLML